MDGEKVISEKMRAALARKSMIMKAKWADPSYRERNLEALKKGINSPECLQKRAEASLRNWADPVWKARQLKLMHAADRTPEHRAKLVAINEENWSQDEFRQAHWEKVRSSSRPEKLAKLSDDDVREIRSMLDANWRVGEIADVFDVSQPIISYIKAGKTYKRVKDEE